MFQGLWPRREPTTLLRKKGKPIIASRSAEADWEDPRSVRQMANFSAQGGKEHGSRKTKVTFNATTTHHSPGAALCRCGGRRDLCLRAKRISGGIYADVEQNGWSDLVICESSKGEKMSHWTQPPVRVCFQLSGWLPASLSHSTRILSQLILSSSLSTCSHFSPLNMCFSPCFLSTKAIFLITFLLLNLDW